MILGAAVALVIAVVIAFAIGLRGGGAEDGSEASSSPTTDPAGASSSASTEDAPTEDGMVDFIETYIATAPSDPAAAFDMLTPAFQVHSHGIAGYEEFWGDVRSTRSSTSRPTRPRSR